MKQPEDSADVAVRLARALERAGIEYAVGRSVASSAYGEPRATRDLDVAVRLTPALALALVDALGPEFAVDPDALYDAIRTGRNRPRCLIRVDRSQRRRACRPGGALGSSSSTCRSVPSSLWTASSSVRCASVTSVASS